MLKLSAGLVSSAFAVCLTQIVFADPKPTPPAPRVLISYQVLEVPSDIGIPSQVPFSDPTSSAVASGFYKAALQNTKSEVTEISVQTPADVPAEARYNRMLVFPAQDSGKPTRIFLNLPMSLEATPHINPDGTITVQLKTEVTRAVPQPKTDDEVPLTNSTSWQTTQTFNSGEVRMFGVTSGFTSERLLVENDPKDLAENKELIAAHNKNFVPFVTVTVLPVAK